MTPSCRHISNRSVPMNLISIRQFSVPRCPLSLAQYQARYSDRDEAMARAYLSTAFTMSHMPPLLTCYSTRTAFSSACCRLHRSRQPPRSFFAEKCLQERPAWAMPRQQGHTQHCGMVAAYLLRLLRLVRSECVPVAARMRQGGKSSATSMSTAMRTDVMASFLTMKKALQKQGFGLLMHSGKKIFCRGNSLPRDGQR